MRVCNCDGMLRRISGRFALRLADWNSHRPPRPQEVAVHEKCPTCGKVWRMQFLCLGSID